MSAQVAMQDMVVYLALLAAVFLYRVQLQRHTGRGADGRLVAMWTWFGVAFATYFTVLGILHQVGMLLGIPAYALFGIGIVVLLICLRTLRVRMRAAATERVSNTRTEGK